MRIVSCNPLEVTGRATSRRPTPACPATTAASGTSFRAEYDRTHREMWAASTRGSRSRARRRCPTSSSSTPREHANLYVFPEEADYTDARPLDATWHRLDSSVREHRRAATSCPRRWPTAPEGSALIYLSLGSLGSADVDLMRRLVDVLGRTPHRYIVSKGPQHAEYELADEHGGRRVPAADHAHPAGRPRHHPRRQQHDDRGAALRQADDPAAAVLGPVRQRAADGRARASASAWRRTRSPTTSWPARSRPSCSTRRPASGSHRSASGCAGATG